MTDEAKGSRYTGWGNPREGHTSHFFDDTHAICGVTWYMNSWDGTLTMQPPNDRPICKLCLHVTAARARRYADE